MLPGIGMFGTSEITKVLVPILRDKGFNIAAIWGRTLREAEEIALELQIPFFTSKIDDVLLRKDVDLVFITCPPHLHSQISVKALGIGKHVVCDKPMSLLQADALKMVRASQYYPSLISIVNHSLRFLPAIGHMKKAIQEGYLGPPEKLALIDVKVRMSSLLHNKFDWLCDETMGGGVLNLVGSHVVDLVKFLTERKAIKVHGTVRTYVKHTGQINGIRLITAPDFCTFQMELDGGTLATVNINCHISNNAFQQEVAVYGSEGHLTVRGGDLVGHRVTGDPVGNIKEEMLYVDVQDLQFCTSETTLPRPYVKGLCKMVGALRDAFQPTKESAGWIKEPVRSAATFEDGLYVQTVLDAIRKSSEERCWCKVNVCTESPTNQKFLTAARLTSATAIH
ncbi:glucose-fructose oxidoreductase domain-containing protein 1-like [Uranotaenia lowii]|uniref:glucose-fructose oxidoreductase domain-containing protein 1-like n=1 Tax=Uranotaenia lowii TaxID=190385 RepID=UPI00247A90C5|nr:glucose-fructose oxidoreductase domain-containing protein 1-like [Uranotaenia lowii]XP_055598288.1 glucose-fructose oxidoreductase domain-containing protein 1-like [Uranotaenia lowii]